MEDVEKGLARRENTPSSQRFLEASSSSIESTRKLTPENALSLRFKILGTIALIVIPIFAVMVVLLVAIIVLYTVIKVPEFIVFGDLTGTVNATLGSVGTAVLYPTLKLTIQLA